MKPIIILPPNIVSADDKKQLTDNGLCVIEATDPSLVRFLDPIPASQDRQVVENAAIQLSRRILNSDFTRHGVVAGMTKTDIRGLFFECLMKGTPLDSNPTIEEQEEKIITMARRNELDKIGREEAREAAAARKAVKAKESTKKPVDESKVK